MKRILNKLFSKLVLGGLIIILQFSWFVYLLYSATVYSSMVDALFKIASIVLALFVSSRDMRSTYKTSWIFLILALPLFGIPAYYLFGRPGLTKRTRMKMDVVSSRIRAYSSPSDDVMSALRAEDDSAGQQAQYLTRYAGYPVYREAELLRRRDVSAVSGRFKNSKILYLSGVFYCRAWKDAGCNC